MDDNTQRAVAVPAATTPPPVWLVSGDVRRRLVVSGGQLRTQVGFSSFIDQYVETIPLADIDRTEVLAPYSPPSSRLGMILLGCAIGSVVGSESEAMTGVVLAITILAFALVTLVVARSVPSAQRIARISTRGGRAYCISYRHEDEPDVKGLFTGAEWCDRTDDLMLTALTPEEKHRADGMRIGIVLATSALALVVLFAYDTPTRHVPVAMGIPASIIIATAWFITIMVNLVAWGKMLVHRAGGTIPLGLRRLGLAPNRRRP